jgi:hypothetical protein
LDSTTVNVFYLPFGPEGTTGDLGPGFIGYTCSASTILVGPHSIQEWPWLLAHEFGHTFNLHHVTDMGDLMCPCIGEGPVVTLPQLDSVFFSAPSSINAVYGIYPSAKVSQAHRSGSIRAPSP